MIHESEVSIADVARYILDQFGRMTTMKLQKLCYYSQSWHLAISGEPLFSSDFEAWDNGPVSRELYELHRGKYTITSEDISPMKTLSTEKKEFVDAIVGKYSKLSGDELSSISHLEFPWRHARESASAVGEANFIITKESMKDFYSSLDNSNSKLIDF